MEILNDVLDHSKIEAASSYYASDPTSLKRPGQSVVALFRSNAEAKGVELSLKLDLRSVDWVLTDAQRLKTDSPKSDRQRDQVH
jgi:signal transduction histidine kinase